MHGWLPSKTLPIPELIFRLEQGLVDLLLGWACLEENAHQAANRVYKRAHRLQRRNFTEIAGYPPNRVYSYAYLSLKNPCLRRSLEDTGSVKYKDDYS